VDRSTLCQAQGKGRESLGNFGFRDPMKGAGGTVTSSGQVPACTLMWDIWAQRPFLSD